MTEALATLYPTGDVMTLTIFDEKWFISTASFLALRDCADHSVAGDVNMVESRALTASYRNIIPSKANPLILKRFIFCQMEENNMSAFGLLLGLMLGMAIAVCSNVLLQPVQYVVADQFHTPS